MVDRSDILNGALSRFQEVERRQYALAGWHDVIETSRRFAGFADLGAAFAFPADLSRIGVWTGENLKAIDALAGARFAAETARRLGIARDVANGFAPFERSESFDAYARIARAAAPLWLSDARPSLGSLVDITYGALSGHAFGATDLSGSSRFDGLADAAEAAARIARVTFPDLAFIDDARVYGAFRRAAEILDARDPSWLERYLRRVDPRSKRGRKRLLRLMVLVISVVFGTMGVVADGLSLDAWYENLHLPDGARPATRDDLDRMQAELAERLVQAVEAAADRRRLDALTRRRTPAYAPGPGRRRLVARIPEGTRLVVDARDAGWAFVVWRDSRAGVEHFLRVRDADLVYVASGETDDGRRSAPPRIDE